MKAATAYETKIFLGQREDDTGIIHADEEVHVIVQRYCEQHDLCCSITPTRFAYKRSGSSEGWEPGHIIGLINYPRDPLGPQLITDHAIKLGRILMTELRQQRVTIQNQLQAVMLEASDA